MWNCENIPSYNVALVRVALNLTWFFWGSLCFPVSLALLGPLGATGLWFWFFPDWVFALGPRLTPQTGYVVVWMHPGIWGSIKHTIRLTGSLLWSHQSGLAGIQANKQKLQLIKHEHTAGQSSWAITHISPLSAYLGHLTVLFNHQLDKGQYRHAWGASINDNVISHWIPNIFEDSQWHGKSVWNSHLKFNFDEL